MSWLHLIDHGMEAQFNPREAVGAETESCLQSWEDDAARRKAELAGAFDIAYGPHQLMRFDYMPAQAGLPVIINIHGGYWRALDKSIMMHHMADLAASGFGIVNVNYPLCPEVSLTEIMTALNGGLADETRAAPLHLAAPVTRSRLALSTEGHRSRHERFRRYRCSQRR